MGLSLKIETKSRKEWPSAQLDRMSCLPFVLASQLQAMPHVQHQVDPLFGRTRMSEGGCGAVARAGLFLKIDTQLQKARPSQQVDRRSHVAIRFRNPFECHAAGAVLVGFLF